MQDENMHNESTKNIRTRSWKVVRFVISRPALASICIGLGIHGLFAVNEAISMGHNYFGGLLMRVKDNVPDGIMAILIPFIIPLIVTSISKRVNVDNTRASLLIYPASNPDMILRLSRQGKVLYFNPAVQQLMDDMGIARDRAEELLPSEYKDILAGLCKACKVRNVEGQVGKHTIEYTFTIFENENSVLVSGRDVTQRKSLELSLSNAYSSMIDMTGFLDSTLKSYDPMNFDIDRHFRAIMAALLRDSTDPSEQNATHIFLANRVEGGGLSGYVYYKQGEQVVKDPDAIDIDPKKEKVAITLGARDVVWSNWEQEAESLEAYQDNFSEKVRQKIGIIERFATYTSGDIAIIAFYRGKRVDTFDAHVLRGLATYAHSLRRISDESKETERAFIYTIESLARASEANDEDTGEHIVRVNKYSRALAHTLGLDSAFVQRIGYSAQMHDMGKIHVPPSILRKSSALDQEEWDLMRKHPVYGSRILGDSSRLSMAAEIALTHHEKYNGTGYPHGLKGEDIPISGRIVMMADVYDALRQARPYKPALSHQQAIDIIARGDERTSPSDFDPKVLKTFIDIEEEIEAIFESEQSE